jgi:hypothetical protein
LDPAADVHGLFGERRNRRWWRRYGLAASDEVTDGNARRRRANIERARIGRTRRSAPAGSRRAATAALESAVDGATSGVVVAQPEALASPV